MVPLERFFPTLQHGCPGPSPGMAKQMEESAIKKPGGEAGLQDDHVYLAKIAIVKNNK